MGRYSVVYSGNLFHRGGSLRSYSTLPRTRDTYAIHSLSLDESSREMVETQHMLPLCENPRKVETGVSEHRHVR